MESLTDLLRKFIISPITALFLYHKKKLLFVILMTAIWLVVLFPKSDTKIFLEQQVSSSTKGKIDLQLEKLTLTPFPLGIKMQSPKVRLKDSKSLKKPLTADSIVISPKMSSLLAFKPGATIYLKNLLGGSGNISATLLGKNKEKSNKFSSTGDLKNLNIKKILELLGTDLKMPGSIELNYDIQGEDSFRKQPKGQFKARMLNLKIPNPLNTPAGPFDFPKSIVWKNSNLFGKIENGKINITEGTLGTKSSEVNGRFKGNIDFSIRKIGKSVSATPGRYDIQVELELSQAFEKEIGGILRAALPRVNKKTVLNGAKYLFRVTGRVPTGGYTPPPRFSPLSSFVDDDL